MIRVASFLLLAAWLSGPAGASTARMVISYPPSPSDYEKVDTAARIVLARPVAALGDDEVRFTVEEVLKGDAGKTLLVQGRTFFAAEAARDPWCILQIQGCFREGDLYLLFLDGEGLRAQEPAPDDDWRRTILLFAGISDLDDPEREAEALRKLRHAAAEDRSGRYPEGLAKRIDLHFALPSPDKPFAELMAFYAAAETDDDRLAVLWALYHGNHAEAPGFFRGLLFAGEPAWLLEPLISWFALDDHADELPRIQDLARIYLAYPPGERQPVLELLVGSAELEDGPLLWSLLPGSTRDEIELLVEGALAPPSEEELAPELPGWLDLPPDERLRTELTAIWLWPDESDAKERLGELLRREAEGRWRSVRSRSELASLFEAAMEPAERRQLLIEIFGRDDEPDLSLVWRLLRHAKDWEADLVLQRVVGLSLEDEELAALYLAARTREERDKALWILGAARASEQLERLRPQDLVRAVLSCPNPQARFHLAAAAASVASAEDKAINGEPPEP